MNELLRDINRDLPPGIDWKAGARDYVRLAIAGAKPGVIEKFSLTKPIAALADRADGLRWLDQATAYLFNFTNILKLLRLPAKSRIMDVACGGGWMSHYFTRFGYRTFGFDIAADFIALAKRRIAEDPYLEVDAESMFAVLDIETAAPGPDHLGAYDAIVLESCLHHFYDPIAALRNLVPCLNEGGVVVLFEGENRQGEIKQDYIDVMVGYRTIERPYARAELIEIMQAAGLTHFEFLGQVNGLFSPKDPLFGAATERLAETERHMNICVCATNRAAIDRILPALPETVPTAAVSVQQASIDHLLKREAELVALLTAITSSKGWRVLEFAKRLIGR